jgi:peptide methionine sulfoxide reductase msrA/msrB
MEYKKKKKEELLHVLTEEEYNVTQNNVTEPPYLNKYNKQFDKGIYIEITTGEPLFISTDKFESGCGWPSFSKPIKKNGVIEIKDTSMGMIRTEIRSVIGDAHLGHVFEDGPQEKGGLRYCINSASLKFIPKNEMEEQGYGDYLIKIK